MARRLSCLSGNSAEFWLNAPRAVDPWDAAQAIGRDMRRIKPRRVAQHPNETGTPLMDAGAPHYRPHFHVVYHDRKCPFAVDTIECIAGSVPQPQQPLLEAWDELHVDDLRAAWTSVQSGASPGTLEPLQAGGRSMSHAMHRVDHVEVVGP